MARKVGWCKMSKDNRFKRITNFEREGAKRNIVIDNIENFVEKRNRYIQIILLLFAVASGAAYELVPEQMQAAVRYTLVLNIFMELYVLQTKDSIMQKKMNWLSVDVTAQNGGLRFEDEIDIDDYNFFENAKRDFVLTGIAPNRFMEKYRAKLEMLLKNNGNFKVYILISSLDAVSENCAEYYGSRTDNDDNSYRYDLLSKLNMVVHTIRTNEIFRNAFKEKRLLLATSDFVFTTSFVAYDLFDDITSFSNIKVTFYQQGEHNPGELPSVILDSEKNIRDMYPYFRKIIANQWDAAKEIDGSEKLKSLSNEILDSMKKCRGNQ
ncbi:MAG: hypothetical protein HDR01_00395 [Lachnospiraceae bacterium]|nr:hypothetical protein [Lachnospiraceae bacterium]